MIEVASDDNIRVRNLLHHAPLRHFALILFNFPLDLRVSLNLFILFLDLLFTHSQLPLVFPPLVQKVQRRNHNKSNDDGDRHALAALEQVSACSFNICVQVFRTLQKL